MIFDPSPEEVFRRMEELDALDHEVMAPEDWFEEALERIILSLCAVRHGVADGNYEDPMKLLLTLSQQLEIIAQHCAHMVPAARLGELVRERLEVMQGRPYRFVGMEDGFFAFAEDDTPVPDHYVEPSA